jgi:single-strand selective monofunctional uracil DNA glycosylase
MSLATVARDLVAELGGLSFGPPVTHVYNPLVYAWEPHRRYLERFGRPPKEVVFVGMNPGPWGMAQTGGPFGEVKAVRDWLGIAGAVGRPAVEHPRRPVAGFDCHRSEVSGSRVWGWARERFGSPERFFVRFFIHNYCPLLFLEESGRNRTPDKLPRAERRAVTAACDRALRRAVEELTPRLVVGMGRFAEERARVALADLVAAGKVTVGRVLHPSPASPAANERWGDKVEEALRGMGVGIP